MKKDFDLIYGGSVGDNMKGIFIGGDVVAWETDSKGQPHHDDVDEDGARYLQMANYTTAANAISIDGSGPELMSAHDLLRWFSEFYPSTMIDVGYGSEGAHFVFHGTVADLRAFFRQHPPPDPDDYDDGIVDTDYEKDYLKWSKLPPKHEIGKKKSAWRGGRDDVWQERDDDTSKGFSVYNNPKLKKLKMFGPQTKGVYLKGKWTIWDVDKNGSPSHWTIESAILDEKIGNIQAEINKNGRSGFLRVRNDMGYREAFSKFYEASPFDPDNFTLTIELDDGRNSDGTISEWVDSTKKNPVSRKRNR